MKIEHNILKSGLNVYLINVSSPLSMFQLFTPFGGDTIEYYDSVQDKKINLQPGSAHYFEHVLFAMKPRKKNELCSDGMKLLQNNKGINVNAYTSHDITNFHFSSRLKQKENLKILTEMVFVPYLPEERFKKETGDILDEIAGSENRSRSVHLTTLMGQLFKKHGAKYPILGTAETITQIKLEDLLSMHEMFYRPSNMTLIVVGNASMKDITQVVEKELKAIGKGDYQEPPKYENPGETDGVVKFNNFEDSLVRKDVANKTIYGAWKYLIDPMSMPIDELIDRRLAMDIIATAIFGSGSRIREYFVNQGMNSTMFGGRTMAFKDHSEIIFADNVEDPEKFQDVIVKKQNDILRTGLSEREIDYAIKYLKLKEDYGINSLENLGTILIDWCRLTGNPENYFKVMKRMKTIETGRVNELMQEIIKTDNLSFCLMKPEE
ncbi:insulinase family protein [Candidatus Woesearchaeota archaeon]|nr:insulinase family protein [Candidatus Woesearchaeota archaeon]